MLTDVAENQAGEGGSISLAVIRLYALVIVDLCWQT